MTAPVRAGVVGSGALLADLVRYGATVDGIRMAMQWPGDVPLPGAATAAGWREMAASPALDALVVLGGDCAVDAAEAGLALGKTVLLPGACVADAAGLDRLAEAERRGGGVLLAGGEISFADASREALSAIASGSMGTVHSLYLAVRAPRPSPGTATVLDALGREALRFVVDCLPGTLLRVHATGAALFGPAVDTVVILARFAPDVVATIELSQCLPAGIPCSRHGEVQFEIVGGAEVLRGEPFAATVRHATDAGWTAQPWGDDPLIAMLAALPAAVRTGAARGRDVAALRRVEAMMAAVRGSQAAA